MAQAFEFVQQLLAHLKGGVVVTKCDLHDFSSSWCLAGAGLAAAGFLAAVLLASAFLVTAAWRRAGFFLAGWQPSWAWRSRGRLGGILDCFTGDVRMFGHLDASGLDLLETLLENFQRAAHRVGDLHVLAVAVGKFLEQDVLSLASSAIRSAV